MFCITFFAHLCRLSTSTDVSSSYSPIVKLVGGKILSVCLFLSFSVCPDNFVTAITSYPLILSSSSSGI